jgi:hypothetical protein
MNADLIGEKMYNDYMDSFQQKLESMSFNGTDFLDGVFGTSTTDFNGPYTIAIDIDGSVYDESTLPFQLSSNGKATYNGAPISLMCMPCLLDCASCQADSFLV